MKRYQWGRLRAGCGWPGWTIRLTTIAPISIWRCRKYLRKRSGFCCRMRRRCIRKQSGRASICTSPDIRTRARFESLCLGRCGRMRIVRANTRLVRGSTGGCEATPARAWAARVCRCVTDARPKPCSSNCRKFSRSERGGEALKQFSLFARFTHLIFGMPLHCQDEAPVATLERFDNAIFRITSADFETRADAAGGLMMPGIDLPARVSCNFRQQRPWLDADLVDAGAFVFELGIVFTGFHMLDKRAAVIDVQKLQSATDGENGEIAGKRLIDELEFDFVANVVRAVGLRMRSLVIAARVHVGSAHQEQAGSTVESQFLRHIARNRFETGRLDRLNVRRYLMRVTEWNQNTFGHPIHWCSACWDRGQT